MASNRQPSTHSNAMSTFSSLELHSLFTGQVGASWESPGANWYTIESSRGLSFFGTGAGPLAQPTSETKVSVLLSCGKLMPTEPADSGHIWTADAARQAK
jgi:hypothetical protein